MLLGWWFMRERSASRTVDQSHRSTLHNAHTSYQHSIRRYTKHGCPPCACSGKSSNLSTSFVWIWLHHKEYFFRMLKMWDPLRSLIPQALWKPDLLARHPRVASVPLLTFWNISSAISLAAWWVQEGHPMWRSPTPRVPWIRNIFWASDGAGEIRKFLLSVRNYPFISFPFLFLFQFLFFFFLWGLRHAKLFVASLL